MAICKKILKNKKLMAVLGMLLVILVTLAVATYTWFFDGGTLLSIEFETGFIQMETYLYEGQDFDRDGVLDTDTTKNVYSPIFELIAADEVNHEGNPVILSGVPDAEIENVKFPDLVMEDLYPGRVYTYKLEMENEGDISSYVDLSFNSIENESELAGIKDIISVEVYADGTEELTQEELDLLPVYEHLQQGKHLLCGWTPSENLTLASGVPFVNTGEQDEDGNDLYKATMIIKVKVEPKKTLDSVLAAQGMSLDTYNSYQGQSFSIPDLTLRLYALD